MTVSSDQIRACLLAKVNQRGPHTTICPSEVARDLGGDAWRDLMPLVRAVGTRLMREGYIKVTQKGKAVDPETVKGPIRYRLLSKVSVIRLR